MCGWLLAPPCWEELCSWQRATVHGQPAIDHGALPSMADRLNSGGPQCYFGWYSSIIFEILLILNLVHVAMYVIGVNIYVALWDAGS